MQGRVDPQRGLADAEGLAGGVVRPGSVTAWLAEHRSALFPDEMFADLFPSGRGRPSIPGEVIAVVMVLKELEGLSDQQAVDAVRFRIDWKVACGLSLDHPGFHPTMLVHWRNRLAASDQPRRIFDAVGEVIAATGILSGRKRRALDSTVVADAVATQDTVTQLISVIRKVRKAIPAAVDVELVGDYTSAGKPACDWSDPDARVDLVSRLVGDAHRLLAAIDVDGLDDGKADAVGLLALIAGQDVEPADADPTSGRWRIARKVAKDRVISTVDPQARHVHKTVHDRTDGFKAHVAVEPETGLVTACALTGGNTADGDTTVIAGLLSGETAPVRVLADSAYGAGATRAALTDAGHTTIIKAKPLPRPSRPDGLGRDDFTIDHTARTATCPAGHTVPISPKGSATFGALCRGCPLRDRCTTASTGRSLNITDHDDLLVAARQAARDPDWKAEYTRWRPMVERSLAWIVRDGHRRVRYRGTARNQAWLDLRAAGINLKQLIGRGLHPTPTGGWALT